MRRVHRVRAVFEAALVEHDFASAMMALGLRASQRHKPVADVQDASPKRA